MANGFLSGRYDYNTKFEIGTDYRSFMPQYTKEGYENSRELLDYLNVLAQEKLAIPSQISLAWMLGNKDYIVPISGSRKVTRLEENMCSSEISLSAEEINKIDEKLD